MSAKLTKGCFIIMDALREHPHSAMQLQNLIQAKGVRTRILDLRKAGFNIITIAVNNPDPDSANPITYYILAGEPKAEAEPLSP